jgi:hypothetical protein
MTKTRGQLISMFQHMKTMSNDNAIKHIRHEDIDTTCGYLLEDKQEIEKLEKALDKACKELEKCEKDFDKIYGTSYAKIKNKKYWKKKVMEDD